MPSAMVEALPRQPTISRWSGISFAASGTAARHAPMACSVVIVIASSRSATSAAIASCLRIAVLLRARRSADEHDGRAIVLLAVPICVADGVQVVRSYNREVRHAPLVERWYDQMNSAARVLACSSRYVTAEVADQHAGRDPGIHGDAFDVIHRCK